VSPGVHHLVSKDIVVHGKNVFAESDGVAPFDWVVLCQDMDFFRS